MTWKAASGGGLLRLIIDVFLFFFCACMYEELPPQLDQFSLQWTNTGQACAPPPHTPCLPINGHPSDCQGISQVVVQLTLTYFIRVVLGVHLLLFGVRYIRTSLEYCHSLYGCWVSHTFLSLILDSEEITEWPASTLFPSCAVALAFTCPQNSSGNLKGVILISPYCFSPHPVLHICDEEWWCGWNGNKGISLFMSEISLALI